MAHKGRWAHKGSKAREVLLTLEQWEEQHGAATGPHLDRGGGSSGESDE